MSDRKAIFISHATPEDNQFTIWLGAKLTALGYEVWADVLRLRGGHDWQRRLESALRNRALKLLLVANPIAVDKQGVRNEIQIASEVARGLKDDAFVIPLRLSPYQSPFLVAQAQYIPFDRGWAAGFRDLITALEEYGVPHNEPVDTNVWRELQTIHSRPLSAVAEKLVSNWAEISHLPPWVYFHTEESAVQAFEAYSRIPYAHGYLSFAGVPPKRGKNNSSAKRLEKFLAEGWNALAIPKHEGRKLITQLINLTLADYLKRRGLGTYMMANRHEAFWAAKSAPTTKVPFDWSPYRGSRLIQGRSLKRGVHWHFAVSPSYQAFPVRHICFRGRLIFTTDGEEPIQSSARMHQLRRSFAKGWRNARWRDMLLAFLYWLAEGSSTLSIPAGPDDSIDIRVPPMFFSSPVGIPANNDDPEPDEDDPIPDFGTEIFDEDAEEADAQET